MFMEKVILDLGCGTAKVAGALGLDVVPLAGVDLVGDLAHRPYPFAANSFDAVYLNDVIEHIPNTIKTMEEVHRILKPNGRAYVRVVNWNSIYTAMDPTHLAAYTENSFDFFGKRVGRSYYTRARFDVVHVKLGFNALARRMCPNERLLYFFSNYLSNVLEDLNFELRAVKKEQQPAAHGEMPGMPPWFALLRCPQALKQGREGAFRLVDYSWLVCDETGCKYPIVRDVPFLSTAEADKWRDVRVEDLPVPPPAYELVPVEDTPIESVGTGGERILPITSPREFFREFFKTYGRLARQSVKRKIQNGFARVSPLRLVRWVGRRITRKSA
jgi:hypothetical protein